MWNTLTGIGTWYIGVILFIWTVAAGIRAYKSQWPMQWPVHGRWIVALNSFGLFLLLIQGAINRLVFGGPKSNVMVLIVIMFAAFTTSWAMWRWVCGGLFESREGS
jgi:hypothetical protein